MRWKNNPDLLNPEGLPDMDMTRRQFINLVGASSLGTFLVRSRLLAEIFPSGGLGFAALEGNDIDPGTPELDIIVRDKTTLYLTYVAGSSGIPVGGKLRVSYSGLNSTCVWGFQVHNPNWSNYVTATTTGSCNLSITPAVEGCQICLYVTILDGPLHEGESIEIIIGDTSAGGPGWGVPKSAGRSVMPFFPNYYLFIYPHAFRVRVALDGENFEDIDEDGRLPINILPRPASSILIAPRTNAAVGIPTSISVMLHDEFGNFDHRFEGTVELSCTDPAAAIPPQIQITAANAGRITLDGVIFNTPGIHRIEAGVPDTDISGRSSAIICTTQQPELKLFWGDLHVHTVASDGRETQEKMFEFAREISGFDFMGTSEHSWKTEHAPIIDQETTQQVEAAYEPGVFTTIKGFEWISSCIPRIGHHNVYYRTLEPPVFAHANGPYCQYQDFFDEIAKYDAIIVPHHVAKAINDFFYKRWGYHPVKQERLVEIYSPHGLCEYQGNPRAANCQKEGHNVQDALALGYKLGVICCSDSHTTRPGARTDEDMTFHDGITAVYAKSNNREDIWQALWDRRCYGTTGFRIVLDFSINGEMMGREIPLRQGQPVELHVMAIGFKEIDSVEVVKGSIGSETPLPVVRAEFPGADIVEFSWTDPSPPSDCFYYIRVTQVDREMAWSSPIWVSPSMRIQHLNHDRLTGNITISWGCLPYRLYGVYYKDSVDDEWQLARTDIPSDESGTIQWTDDGTYTVIHPSNIRKRLYAVRADT